MVALCADINAVMSTAVQHHRHGRCSRRSTTTGGATTHVDAVTTSFAAVTQFDNIWIAVGGSDTGATTA